MRTLLLLPCLTLTLAAQDAVPVQAPITSVKLYPDEAWVTRVGRVQAAAGTRRYRIEGLPGGLTLDDVQVSAKGPAGSRLGDVSISQQEVDATETPEWKRIQADLDALGDRQDQLESRIEAAHQEIAFLESLKAAQAQAVDAKLATAPPSFAPIAAFSQGMQGRLTQLLTEERKAKRELAKAGEEQKGLEADQASLSAGDAKGSTEVLVDLSASAPGPLQIQLNYRTRKAHWSPAYEARLSEDRKRLELTLLAAVTQESGEDWNGVHMEISNARPSRSLVMQRYAGPQTLSLAPVTTVIENLSRVDATSSSQGLDTSVDAIRSVPTGRDFGSLAFLAPGAAPSEPEEAGAPSAAILEASGLNLDFRLDGTLDVPSDADPHRFKLMAQTLKPDLALVTTPRLDAAVYQVARFQDPGGLPIFAGAPLVQYAGDQRLGQSPLATPATGQPYQLGFGPYRGLRVTFRRVDHTQETVGAFTKERQWTYRERAELSSELAVPVDVEVQDRVLKSGVDAVKVNDLPDTTPGAKEALPGVRSWTVHVEPSKTASVTIATQVRGPLEGRIAGLDEPQ